MTDEAEQRGPSSRGPHGVGVRTEELNNLRRDEAAFTAEFWYPAGATNEAEDAFEVPSLGPIVQRAARDAEPAPGRHPLVLLSHGYVGHRRQLSYLATHLASHGYVVAAPDHEHLTRKDVQLLAFTAAMRAEPMGIDASLRRVIWQHPTELWQCHRSLEAGTVPWLAPHVDPKRLAVGGYCVGAWVAAKALSNLLQAQAAFFLAPVGGSDEGLAGALADEPTPSWEGTESLVVAGARDSVTPLRGVENLFSLLPSPKRMAILPAVEHQQFATLGDATLRWMTTAPARKLVPTLEPTAPPEQLAPTEGVHAAVVALVLAQLDATMRNDVEAERVLTTDPRMKRIVERP